MIGLRMPVQLTRTLLWLLAAIFVILLVGSRAGLPEIVLVLTGALIASRVIGSRRTQ